PGDAQLQLREARGDLVGQPVAQFLARVDAFGTHHELGEVGRGELLVQRQVEARRTGADVGDEVVDTLAFGEHRFQPLRLRGGRAQRRAFGQFHVHHQLRPDRKSTRLNSSHVKSSYAVFCLKKKKNLKLSDS